MPSLVTCFNDYMIVLFIANNILPLLGLKTPRKQTTKSCLQNFKKTFSSNYTMLNIQRLEGKPNPVDPDET